eukprot:CAMPEP_0197846856 /NCGR_PEP_ID=MMETSP1438-20131217/4647_1 /TAXON_ID=1461541 /ORGANISM="Pterosperma sp., Strain CCMP1384" /LENGTH=96 /DNA_ID=CAMNT_0043458631 /DNA_START=60 /DNA_END=350 /DNA_ORIENTATION=+
MSKYQGKTYPEEYVSNGPAGDPAEFLFEKEHKTVERLVAVGTAQVWRDQVRECYRTEGVNHYENCKEVVVNYLNAIKGTSIGNINQEVPANTERFS